MLKCAPIITPDAVRDALELARECYAELPSATERGIATFRRATEYSGFMGGILAGKYRLWGCADSELRGVAAMRGDDHVMLLFVEREYRGRRVGTALLEAMLDYAAERHVSEVTVNADPDAAEFYAKFDFRATEAAQERDGIAFLPMAVEIPAD